MSLSWLKSSESRSSSDEDRAFLTSPALGSSLTTTLEACSPPLTARQVTQIAHDTILDPFISYNDNLLPAIPKTEPIQPLLIDAQTPDSWIARDDRMIRLTGKHPCNIEAPLSALFKAGFLTPQNLFYVRSHGDTPRVSMKQGQEWKLRVHGLVENEMQFSIQDLKEIFPVITLPVTLVCAGNRRKEQNMVAKGLGFNWGAAGVSTGLFTGVYLSDILKYCKPKNPLLSSYPSYDKPVPGRARHVIFEGVDELPKGKYGTSQRLNWALDRTKGMLICWGLNGEDLSPDHGYPLRLVVPGQIGGRMVKWLHRIEVSDCESQHYLHFFDNKLLPTMVTPDQARSEDKWWFDPKYIINELNTNAAICSPAHDETVQLATSFSSVKKITIQGYAYTGGGRRITRVEVTLDDGKTWSLSDIKYPEDLYRIYPIEYHPYFGKIDLSITDMSFSWCFWSLDIDAKSLLDQDISFIAVRAMDEALSVMPRDMYWNATSMMNSWWYRVAIHKENSNRTLRFEHPTLAGNASGGWMQRMKDADEDPRFPYLGGKSSSKSFSNCLAREMDTFQRVADSAMINPAKNSIIITTDQLAEHSDSEGPFPWFVVQGHVYDGTDFLLDHPGGDQSIRLAAGGDATEDFMSIHSIDAKKMLKNYHIGKLLSQATISNFPARQLEAQDDPSKPFLEPNIWKEVLLVHKRSVSHDSRIFRFALPHDDQLLRVPAGQHIYLRVKKPNDTTRKVEIMQRAYTPYSCDTHHGFIDLLIKVYFPSRDLSESNGRFVGGKMTMLLENMVVDAKTDTLSLEMRGPIGQLTYIGHGQVQWKSSNRFRKIKRLVMIAAGSGITPIWSILKAIADEYAVGLLSSSREPIHMWLIYGNRTEEDILLREELETISKYMDGNLRIWHVLSSKTTGADWKMGRGHIGLECLQQHLPPPPSALDSVGIEETLALICGPLPMKKSVTAALSELGWNHETNVVLF